MKLEMSESFTVKLLSFLSFMFLFAFVFMLCKDINVKSSYEDLDAKLYNEHSYWSDGEYITRYYYSYEVSGLEYSYDTLNYRGDTITLYYEPLNPSNAVVLNTFMMYFTVLSLSVGTFLAYLKCRRIFEQSKDTVTGYKGV